MSEWLNVKLNTVTSYIKRGVSPKYVETVGYTIINQKCIRDNRVTYENSKLLDKTQKIVKEKYLQDGDVLVNSTGTGTLGRVAQYKEIEERVFCDSHVSIVRANELINKKFLSYYLSYSEPMIETYGKGATNQKELSPYDLGLIKINLPPLPTQQKIAKILSYYDDLIENNLKCIKLLEESARLTYEEWFLRFRIDGKELDINPDSGLPLGWELVKVGSLLQRIKNTVKIKSSEILESGKNPVIDQGADFISGYTNEANINQFNDTPFIVFGDHTRILKFVNFSFARGADGTQILISNNKRMPQTLFYHSLKALNLSNYYYARHYKFLKEEKVILPTETVSTAFNNKCIIIFEQIKNLRNQNRLLMEARDILLPRLMTGIIDTKKMSITI